MAHHLFTSESVTEGHPDKVCDQISDAILDSIIKDDHDARVACETLVTTGLVMIAGEITTSTYVDIPEIARNTVKRIGYTDASFGFDYETCAVLTSIHAQSPDIAMGVDESEEHQQGAGDQGMMFGYACDETEELMPLPITLAHRLTMRLAKVRKKGILDYLRPDGKSQVTVEYQDDQPVRIEAVVVSTQHCDSVKTKRLHSDVREAIIDATLPKEMIDAKTKIYINPTGRFVIGGPKGDTGVTGRKIIVDTYGGKGSHGGGCFSGKDPTKVDRSASYAARHVAKNIVAAGLAKRCEVQLAYAIGVAEPVSVMIDTLGTGTVSDDTLVKQVREHFDLTPAGIIARLRLRRPIYEKTASYGHFGREDKDFTWEHTDYAEILKG